MTIAFLKGHAMNRGTLMVLKRFVIMALGALGLGALTAGPTFAQQIPAPDAYGDPQACAAAVKVVKAVVDEGKVQDNGLTPMQEAALTNMARACPGDVGGGIAKARTLWQAAVDAKDELDDAQKAYDADDSARNKEDRDEATEAHMDAVTARNDYAGGGAIYEAVFEEENRLAKAEAASSAFTKAEAAADTAQALRDTVELENYITDFAGFDATGQAYEFETYTVLTTKAIPADGNTPAVPAVYTTYVRVKKQGGATVGLVRQDPEDDTSQLIVPPDFELTKIGPDGMDDGTVSFAVETIDHDLDDTTDMISFLRVTTDVLDDNRDSTTIGMVNSEYKMAKKNLTTAEKALKGNQDGNLTVGLTEDVRRAQAQYDFFAAQKGRVEKSLAAGKLVVDRMGDNPATPNEVETDFDLQDTPYTVEDYEALTDLQGAETDAADALKDAYDDRVAATNDLETNQRDTQAYLDQLVALRQNEKAAADAAALKAEAEEETAAQKTANENLATANAQLKSFTDLQALDDANPVKALVNSLVAAEDSAEDDDGQALVDAISSNYDTASDAKTTATAAMDAVEGLSGEEGTVAANTAAIAENDGEIERIDGVSIANETAIADHDMKLMLKKQYIENLGAEVGFDPATNMGTGPDGMSRIDMNEAAIAGEATAREAADTALGGRIDTNVTSIATNATAITAEQTARMEADTMLGGRIDTNATGIMTNAGGIEMNLGSIGANATAISSNADGIAANMSSIGSNASAISDNRNMIGELSDDLSVVRAGVAASMALAGMPAINGRGISIGVGSFDGESAFAVGFQIQGEMASFKVGVTSGGGATGASAGVGFQF